MIGDGTYLMGNTGELVTAGQEGLKITVIVFENGGYQSIHGAAARRTGRSFGLEFRGLAGDVDVDYAANARSLGCAAYEAGHDRASSPKRSTRRARTTAGRSVIVARVEPRRLHAGLGLLVGRGRGGGVGPLRDARARGRARYAAGQLQRYGAVRIVATAEVPPSRAARSRPSGRSGRTGR